MAHYYYNDQIVGHGSTARELSHLAQLFSEVRHLACLHSGVPSSMNLPYEASNITLVPLPPTGGTGLIDKLKILIYTPTYIYKILRELLYADVVHVRCPANIPLIAIILLTLFPVPRKRWIKYAGNWHPDGKDALSYRFQRWWLRRNFARALVTVNGQWPDAPKHVHAFLNPCLTNEELMDGRDIAAKKELSLPLRFLFVGRVEEAKGIRYALETIAALAKKDIAVQFDIIGDGPERPELENLATCLAIQKCVRFHGWKARNEINAFYQNAHFFLFPSHSEGWPKVLSEAMAFGVVPLASNVSSIPQYLKAFGSGRAFPANEIDSFRDAALRYYKLPEQWKVESGNSVIAASLFTYDAYLDAVRNLLEIT